MDKSDSELLEEWDLVSSVYDTEQANGMTEKKTDAQTESKSDNDNVNGDGENGNEATLRSSEADSKETTDVPSDEAAVSRDTRQTVEAVVDPNETLVEAAEANTTPEQMTGDGDVVEVMTYDEEPISKSDVTEETKVRSTTEQTSATADLQYAEKNIEVTNEDTGENETEMDVAAVQRVAEENISKTDDSSIERRGDGIEKNVSEPIPDRKTDTSVEWMSADNSDDHAVNSSLDSSMEHIQIEHCEGSFVQDVPELIPDLVEQENAGIESSSSDIDVIDENVEESVTSSFIHPLSLSISSSVADSSSVLTTPSEDDKVKREQRIEDIKVSKKTETHFEKPPPYSESSKTSESFPSSSESYFQESRYEDRSESIRPEPQRSHHNMFAGILEFIRNMTRFEWSLLGGFMFCLYITVVFNQTNIFAVVEKEDVATQMKKMIDELKYDNKILKDQMLSEMKNEKVFSTFEHQIKELKKENSKLNHMLYDVAKVLEEQKDTQKRFQRRESEYVAPFKKEINVLKEHINILKFDNEELQKQLVRMRYASYSQGGRDTGEDKTKEQKEEPKETTSTEEIALDINSLRKWNELITLLSKELGLSENEPLMGDPSQTDTHNISWYWKTFLREFKGTFKDLKANVTSVISDYKKANEKAVSEIYKFVKDFFTVKEENDRKFTSSPGEESAQWKNIGDFVKDLSDKWTKIKDRIYTSDIKNFIRSFKKSDLADAPDDSYDSEKTQSTADTDYYTHRKPTTDHFESGRKQDKREMDAEDSKWMFKRAELRAEFRDAEKEEDSVNWYLKRKKHTSKYDTEE